MIGEGWANRSGATFDERFEEIVVAPMVVQPDFAGERGVHVHQGGQFVEVDLDSGGEVFGVRAGRGNTDGDGFADVAHFVGCQHGLHRWFETWQARYRDDRLDARQIRRGEDGSFGADGFANVADVRVRDGAAHECEFAHAGQADVGDEFALATQIAIVFQSRNGSTDTLARAGTRGSVHPSPFPLAPCARPSAY